MNKLGEWAKSKPVPIAIIAQQIAFSADYCYQALKSRESGEQIEGLIKEEWDEIQKFWKEVYGVSLNDIKSDISVMPNGIPWTF